MDQGVIVSTRDSVLDAAKRLFARKGFDGASVRAICAAAEASSNAVTYHFGSKQALFKEIVDNWTSEQLDLAERLLAAKPESGEEFRVRLALFLGEALEALHRERDVVRILFSRDSEAAAVEANVLNDLAATIAANRRSRIAAGELSADVDPDVLAQSVVGLLARVVAWWVEDPSRASRAAVVETLTRVQLAGTHPETEE